MRGMLTSRRTSTYTVAHWDTMNNNSYSLDKHPANAPVCGRWSVVLCAVVSVVVRKKKKSCTHPRVETQMELFSLKPPSSSSSSPPPPVSRWTPQLRVCVSVCFWGRSPPIILQSSDYSDRVHHQNSRVVMCTVKLYTHRQEQTVELAPFVKCKWRSTHA